MTRSKRSLADSIELRDLPATQLTTEHAEVRGGALGSAFASALKAIGEGVATMARKD